jgi:hypothetical protein
VLTEGTDQILGNLQLLGLGESVGLHHLILNWK